MIWISQDGARSRTSRIVRLDASGFGLDLWGAETAAPDRGHPRANFLGTVGHASRSDEPWLFSTELVAQFAPAVEAEVPEADDDADPTNAALIGQARLQAA